MRPTTVIFALLLYTCNSVAQQAPPALPQSTPVPQQQQLQGKPKPKPTPSPRRQVRQVVEVQRGPVLSLGPTHILPSAYVLPAGSFILGTTAGFGVGNFMDITTSLWGDIEQVYNVMIEFGVLKGRNVALGLWLQYENEGQQVITTNPTSGLATVLTTSFSSVNPGLTLSYRLSRRFTAHTGGDIALQSPVIPKSSLSQTTSYIQGNTVHQEFTVGLTQYVAMSFGGSYDLTYGVAGAGVSFHIDALQVGAHYYFNISQGSILPILGGSFPVNF